PRGRADGGGGITVGELQPVGGEAVEVRCADGGMAETAEVAITEVITQENDDVGPRGRGWGDSGGPRGEGEGEGEGGERAEQEETASGHGGVREGKRGRRTAEAEESCASAASFILRAGRLRCRRARRAGSPAHGARSITIVAPAEGRGPDLHKGEERVGEHDR